MQNQKLNNFPFAPNKLPFFYGWAILTFGAIGILMSIPGQTMGVSLFTGHLSEALQISRLNLSLTYMIGTILSSLVLAQAGKFYDKFGVRITIVLSSLLLALVLLFLSSIDKTAGLLSERLPFSFEVWGFGLVTIGFFLLRFSGQGVMTMVSRSMVMKWFDKRRGVAAAIMGIFTTFGFSYAPKILDRMIDGVGWRSSWKILALICGVLFAFVAFIFFRDNPVSCGLKSDSLRDIKVIGEIKKRRIGADISLKEAKKFSLLWFFAISLTLWAMFNTALTFHIVPIFESAGLDKASAVDIFFPVSVIAVASRFLVSWISDHIKLEIIFVVYLMGMILAGISLYLLGYPVARISLIAGLGIAGGLFGVLNSITWVRMFGKKHLGAIAGFSMGWVVAGSAVGPYFFSLSEKISGSYKWGGVFVIVLSLLLLAGIILKLVKSNMKIRT